jgi:hypothetical protein
VGHQGDPQQHQQQQGAVGGCIPFEKPEKGIQHLGTLAGDLKPGSGARQLKGGSGRMDLEKKFGCKYIVADFNQDPGPGF